MKRKYFNILTLVIMMITGSLAGFTQTYEKDYADGKIYIKFKDEVRVDIPVNADRTVDIEKVSFLNTLRNQYDITGMSRPLDLNHDFKLLRTFEIECSRFDQVNDLVAGLQKNPDLEYVEKVAIYHINFTPNDTLYNLEYGNSNWNWHLDVINAEMAWDFHQGDPDINVAIVDNAVWIDHPDLTDKIVLSYDVTAPPGNNNSNPPAGGDPGLWSHGTHVAGLSGAETNNGIGVASIGYNVSLIGIKASSNNAPTIITHSQAGMQYAANNGADVISMSFGSSVYNQTIQNLVNTIHNLGIVMLAAAGNDYSNIAQYPAAYNHVISVASTNENDVKTDFSNYGTTIDICAPGGYGTSGPNGLVSTTWEQTNLGYYASYFGTSMSTPLAAGLAGLILSVNPLLTPDEVENIMKSTCTDIYGIPGNANYIGLLGAGRIDAHAAVMNTPFAPTANFMTPVTTILPASAIQFFDESVGVPNSWSWEFQGGNPTLSNLQNPMVVYDTPGVYTVYLTVTNNFGTDNETKTGYIQVTDSPTPWILFSSDTDYVCNKSTVTFTDESLYDPTVWNWSFEPATVSFVNGTTASSQNPEVRFESPGTYNVSLTAENANGPSTGTKENMITVEGIQLNFSEDFESGMSGTFNLDRNSRAKVTIDHRSAAPGSEYGLHFQGSSLTGGWSGGPTNTTPQQAWETNSNFHGWAENCSVDATGIEGVGLTFDLRQTFSIGNTYSWLRVLIDGEQVADLDGVENFNPITNTDPFETRVFDLSAYGNSLFSITFQSACYLSDKFYAEGDNVFIDNIMLSNTTPVNEEGLQFTGMLTYPNPARDELNFSVHGVGQQIEVKVLNFQGQTLKYQPEYNYQHGDTRRINISDLPPGIYVLQLSGTQGVATKKFVVN